MNMKKTLTAIALGFGILAGAGNAQAAGSGPKPPTVASEFRNPSHDPCIASRAVAWTLNKEPWRLKR